MSKSQKTDSDSTYPFGMVQPGRFYSSGEVYRYGFQGQEKDDEVKGNGNSINYKYRMHDTRLGRFLSLDPLAPSYPHNSPYAFSENRVLDRIELEGLESAIPESISQVGYKIELEVKNAFQVSKDAWNSAGEFMGEVGQGLVNLAKDYEEHRSNYVSSGSAMGLPTFDNLGYGQLKEINETIAQIPLIPEAWQQGDVSERTEMLAGIGLLLITEGKGFYGKARLWRGGNFALREIDASFDTDGIWIKGGPSVDMDPLNPNVAGRGAFEIESIPEGLQAVHRPSKNNPNHYQIEPINPKTTKEQFQEFLQKIEVYLDNPAYPKAEQK